MTTTIAAIEIRDVEQSPAAHLGIALGLQVFMIALIGFLVRANAWDDGAITLAFSRTFAATGHIALTAASEQVEGFSSITWFLINALISLFRPGFDGAILASQISAGIFLGVATAFMWLIARELRLQSGTTLAILIVFSLFGPAISEVANGMEMTLFAAAGLALVYALYFRENQSLLIVAVIVFLTTRYEAMIYYAVLLLPLLLRKQFRIFVLLATFGLVIAGLQEAARFILFGDLFPNTIYAKMHPPYSTAGFRAIVMRIKGAAEIANVLFPLICALILLTFAAQKRNQLARRLRDLAAKRELIVVLAVPIVAGELGCILIGLNWGYLGRMPFFALPFALLLFGLLFDQLASSEKPASRRIALVAILIFIIPFSWLKSASEPLAQMERTLAAGGRDAPEQFGVTPDTYRKTGLAVDRVRQLLGLDTIIFVTPDVGGLALCCNHIRIVDIAMLTNRRLAKEGYGALPSVLADENPDIIEVHDNWASLSQIYTIPDFKENYQPIIIEKTRLFLRNDHAKKLIEMHAAALCRIEEAQCRTMALVTHRYVENSLESDDKAFTAKGTVLIIKDRTSS